MFKFSFPSRFVVVQRLKCSIFLTQAGISRGDFMPSPGAVFVSASHQTELDTKSMARRSIIVGMKGGESRTQAEAQALLVYAGHWPTSSNVGLMSLAGHGPNSRSRYGCLILLKLDSKVQSYTNVTKVSMM